MKIATFTDHIFTPSSRFRIRQYIPILHNNGFDVHDYYRKYSTETVSSRDSGQRIRNNYRLITKAICYEALNLMSRLHDSLESNKYDIVWLSRQLIIGYPSFECLIKKPLVYDVDDAIFLTSNLANLQFKISAKRASAVIAGNVFLAEAASNYCKNITIIPTAVDTLRWKPLGRNNINVDSDHFTIGWSGTSSSYKYFIPIEKDIKQFLLEFPSAKLTFMADRFPEELKTLAPLIKFKKWSLDDEVFFIQSLDVGLMPIADDLWSKGKCAYKSLLYLACGIPVIMSPIGVNGQLLEQSNIGLGPINPNEWYEALCYLFNNRSYAMQLGVNGIDLVEKSYSLNACAPKIINTLNQIS